MLEMIDVEYIRKLRYVKGWSIREIAKSIGHSRNTIAKYSSEESKEPKYQIKKIRTKPVLGKYEEVIKQWIEADKEMPVKQRHTAHRIYERLREEYRYLGSEASVRRLVRKVKKPKAEAYLPLEYELGYEAQCDFGQAEAIINGQRVTIHMFCMKLMASQRHFVVLFPHQKSEAFFEGHRQAFEFFGGVPKKISYDNPKVAVAVVLKGRERIEQVGFIALRSHYLFESFFCMPGKKGSHEKGGVENLVGYARRNYLVPMPEVDSLKELNEKVKEKCLAQALSQYKKETLAQLWQKEQTYLLALPRYPFECFRVELAKVNSLQMIQFENCRYSVPREYVGQSVIIKAFIENLEIVSADKIIATHSRLYQAKEESLKVEHYLDLLEQRPGAVANARVFSHLEEVYQIFRKLCLQQVPPTPKEFVKVLKLHEKFSQATVKMALKEAIACNIVRADAVNHICQRLTEAPQIKGFNYPVQTSITIRSMDLKCFDQLLEAKK